MRDTCEHGWVKEFGNCPECNKAANGNTTPCTCSACVEERDKREWTERWYGVRWQRLRDLIHEKAPEIEREACCIIANGTTGAAEPPTYAQMLNTLRYEVEKLKKQNASCEA